MLAVASYSKGKGVSGAASAAGHKRLGRLLLFKEGGSERVQRVHDGRGLSEGRGLSIGSTRGLLAVVVNRSGDDAGSLGNLRRVSIVKFHD